MRYSAIGVVTLSFLVGTAVVARAECKPAAIPLGDASLVKRVTERLAANGVSTTAVDGCPAVRVHLEQRGPEVHLRVADGQRGERQVQDIATAAAVIESWTLHEVDEGVLPEAPLVLAPIVAPERFGLAVAGLSSVASDGTLWLGGEIAGCVHVSWACIGGVTSIAATTDTVDDMARGAQRSKTVRVLLMAEAPRRLGRFTVSPGVGVGYGWMSFAQQHTDIHMLPESVESSIHALRTRAHLSLAHGLGSQLAIVATTFGELAPLRSSVAEPPPAAELGVTLGLRLGVR